MTEGLSLYTSAKICNRTLRPAQGDSLNVILSGAKNLKLRITHYELSQVGLYLNIVALAFKFNGNFTLGGSYKALCIVHIFR